MAVLIAMALVWATRAPHVAQAGTVFGLRAEAVSRHSLADLRLSADADADADTDATPATTASAAAAAAAAPSSSYSVSLPYKPFGIVLSSNPSGRGVCVCEVLAGGSAAASSPRIESGDYLVRVGSRECAWLGVAEVRALVDVSSAPLALGFERGGGAEPWRTQRGGDGGLSVDEMVEEASREYGPMLDNEGEEALRAAFGALKEEERRAAVEGAMSGGYESGVLRAASRLQTELRSFARGARESLARLAAVVTDRALLDAKLAVSTAEYLLRRTLLDTGRVLAAGFGADGGGGAAPFRARLSQVEAVRALGGAQAAAALSSAEAEGSEAAAETARRDAALRTEAAALLREALVGIEAWVRVQAESRESGVAPATAGSSSAAAEPDWDGMGARARVLGGELGTSLSTALKELRVDFVAYQDLAAAGQLPTVLEELQETTETVVGASAAGDGGVAARSSMAPLRSFAGGDDPAAQRRERSARRDAEVRAKQLKLGLTVGNRAGKDTADALVIGVLPTVRAVGKLAAQRAAERLAGAGADQQEQQRRRQRGSVVGELAAEIAREYRTEVERSRRQGPLAGLQDAMDEPVQALRRDFETAAATVGSFFEPVERESVEREPVERANETATPPTAAAAEVDELISAEAVEAVATVDTSFSEAITAVDASSSEVASAVDAPFSEAVSAVDASSSEAVAAVDTSSSEEVATVDTSPLEAVNTVGTSSSEAVTAVEDGPRERGGVLAAPESAIDVGAVAEVDQDERERERQAQMLDAALVVAEGATVDVVSAITEVLTPEDLRGWKLLRSLRASDVDERAQQRRAKAAAQLLDGVSRNLDRS